jgi:putative membrane protein
MTPLNDSNMTDERAGLFRGPEGWALIGLFAFTAVALAGYSIFGLNPANLPADAWATRFYSISFPLFARAHIIVTGVVLIVALVRHAGLRWVPALAAIYAVSFLAEHVGTGYGFPFSGYSYTGLLGPKLAGRVPYVIPLSWFLMSAPAYVIARSTFSGASRALPRIVFAAVLLTTWDLALDPAMSFLTPYWLWETSGPFYGMPWVNLAGWLLTGLVIMAVLEVMERRGRGWSGTLPVRWSAAYYGGVLLMPLGMVTAAGLWWAVIATVGTLVLLRGVHVVAQGASLRDPGEGPRSTERPLAASGGPSR